MAQADAIFVQDEQIGVLIGVENYEQNLDSKGRPNYDNLPTVQEDLRSMERSMRHLGFERIEKLYNPNFYELNAFFSKIAAEMDESSKKGFRTLIFVYYTGHGQMDERVIAVLNEQKSFQLERKLRNLSILESNYVIGLFDCCR